MPSSSTSVVPIGNKTCQPFLLEVMVYSPEAGYKFKVDVERDCTPQADPIWKLVFDLYRIDGTTETQLVHVSYTSGTPVQAQAVQNIAGQGVKPKQADVLVNEVHPAAKAIVGVNKPTAAQKKRVHDAMQKVVSVDV